MKITSLTNKGRRQYMEDFVSFADNGTYTISGVFDGHGGDDCSFFLKTFFISIFDIFYKKNRNIKYSLYYTIVKIHSFIIRKRLTRSGSTCNILVIDKVHRKYYIANVGDSRTLISYKNNKCKQITTDHKPTNISEYKRIYKSGGFVENDRVNGILSMSRAIGDYDLAKYLSPVPDIYEGKITNNISFFLQISDGMYETMTNGEVCEIIQRLLKRNVSHQNILYYLINYALYAKKTVDNMSVILIVK